MIFLLSSACILYRLNVEQMPGQQEWPLQWLLILLATLPFVQKLTTQEPSKCHITDPLWWEWLVDTPLKGPLMWKTFPWNDIMFLLKRGQLYLLVGSYITWYFVCKVSMWNAECTGSNIHFYTPVFKCPFEKRTFKRTYYAVTMSVRPSAFSGLFFNMLWDINLKLGIYIQ